MLDTHTDMQAHTHIDILEIRLPCFSSHKIIPGQNETQTDRDRQTDKQTDRPYMDRQWHSYGFCHVPRHINRMN